MCIRDRENTLYSSTAAHIRHLPWLYLGLFLTAAALMLLLIRVLSRAVVRPLLRLAQASRSIAEGDLSSPDLPVKSSDEVGRLTGTFNQMKHAMAQQLTTQPVSYTHLDVYKRQVQRQSHQLTIIVVDDGDRVIGKGVACADGAAHRLLQGFQVRICLLYTSRCV